MRQAFEPLRAQLQEALSAFLKQRCLLIPAKGKGGYDRLYYVDVDGQRIAMMRVRNPQADQALADAGDEIRRPLRAAERLEQEWNAYSVLSEKGLSPKPVWRTQEAIVSSYYPYARASELLKADANQVWALIPHLFRLVRAMHDEKIVHMDLNLGNVLIDPASCQAMAIDFEYAPARGLSFVQASLCDYCRVINDLLRPRRGGRALRKNGGRLTEMLRREWPETLIGGDVAAIAVHFPHLIRNKEVLHTVEALCSPNSK